VENHEVLERDLSEVEHRLLALGRGEVDGEAPEGLEVRN
jgi:hypothetical protein